MRRTWSRRLALLPALALLSTGGNRSEPSAPETCSLCAPGPGVPVVPLEEAALDSAARVIAADNQRQLGRLDSLLQAGAFGPAAGEDARRRVHLLARLSTRNCYHYLFRFAADSTRIVEAGESTLARVFARYTDPSLFGIARLQRARIGRGRLCLRYDVEARGEGVTVLGEKRLHYQVKEAELGGRRRRVLSMDLPTGSHEMVEVLLAEHYTCALQHLADDGPPGPYEAWVVRDIQGGWLRKWGTHRPTAFMFWTTPQASSELPAVPLLGVRVYVPNLKLKLPYILPDIGFDDLRNVELPEPLLETSYIAENRFPAWIENVPQRGFKDWVGYGDVPRPLRALFPDQ